MKYSGWDYLDHMVCTYEEILEYASVFSDEHEFKLIDRVRELYPALKQQQCTNGPIELD